MWNERTKQDRHETPVGVRYQETQRGSLSDDTTLWDAHRPPENETEALMQPGDNRVTAEQYEGAWGNIQTLLDCAALTEKELAVLEYITFGGMSLAEAGRWLGLQFRENGQPFSKMMVSKLRDSGLMKLRAAFPEETFGTFVVDGEQE